MTTANEPLPTDLLAAMLEASASAFAAETRALGALATTRPGPDDWCANEILGHIIESERRAFNGRIREVIAAPGAPLGGYVVTARDDRAATPEALLKELAELRADSIALVRSLTPEQLPLLGIHARVGPLSVDDLAHEWVHHDREHLKQLLDVTRTFAWRGMGGARRFTDPDA